MLCCPLALRAIQRKIQSIIANNTNRSHADTDNARLEALVTNDAEKKMIAQIAKENGGDDVAAWKMDAINKLAESVTL